MEPLTRNQLHSLATLAASPCVSVFFPAVGGTRADRQDLLRLRNLLRRAASELRSRGLAESEVNELLAPARALEGEATFWASPPGGVALYAAPGFFRRVRVDFPLPEALRIGDRFATRPLLPLLDRPERVLVLAVSLKRVRLVEATAGGHHLLRLPELPSGYRSAMGFVEYDTNLSAHSASPSALGPRGPIFHGHGGDDEENFEADLEHFCQRIVAPVVRAFAERPATLVLACVEEYVPYLRRAAAGLEVLAEAILGNPDRLSDAELVVAARERVEAAHERSVDGELVRWNELRGGGRGSADFDAIVRAADQGRIETLFVAHEAERWGSYEPDLGRVAVHERREPGDEDLLDLAVSRTLAQRGDVHALPLAAMPEGRAVVAILRWAQAA